MYKHLVRLFGGRPVFYDTYPDFRLRGEEIEALITPRTKIMIVSSPSTLPGPSIQKRTEGDRPDRPEAQYLHHLG